MYQLYFTPDYVADIRARVKRGVKFLEKQKGPTWFNLIKIPTLDLEDPEVCILGQTFKREAASSKHTSGFDLAYKKMRLKNNGIYQGFNLGSADELPFYSLPDTDRKNAVNPWTLLGETWIDEIRAARKKATREPR